MILEFNQQNLDNISNEFIDNQNFVHITFPRLKSLLAIKKELKEMANLSWFVEFNHINTNKNRVFINYTHTKGDDLSFFYEIPLNQRFELRAYLANSSVHFIDLYNFLLEKKILTEDQYQLKAEYHTIPHFILNTEVKRYDTRILNCNNSVENYIDLKVDVSLKDEIESNIKKFNSIYEQILNQFKI
jgi:hypothetical protein